MIYNFLSLCYEYLGGEGNIMTEIRGQSRIILSKISIISTTLIKILIIISNQDCHLQGSRSSRAGQRARSVLQARVITSDFSGNHKKRNPLIQPTKRIPQIQPNNVTMFQVLQAGHPPVLHHQAADVLHCHHSSGHNQSSMNHMRLGAR